jgi:hypothetical protein
MFVSTLNYAREEASSMQQQGRGSISINEDCLAVTTSMVVALRLLFIEGRATTTAAYRDRRNIIC